MALRFIDKPPSLENLKYVSAQDVEQYINDLKTVLSGNKDGRKIIAVIGTGGTISMKIEDGIRLPDLDFNNVLARTHTDLTDKFEFVPLDAFCIDSSQMNYGHVMDLAIICHAIWSACPDCFAGFLIAHGTDTMAYSAAALSLCLGQGLPFSVVYTGAQKSIQEPMNDAGQNLRNAVYTLEALSDKNMAEVVIVMGDRAILGTSSMKVDDTLANAFDAPMHDYVARFASLEYPVRLAPWLKEKRKGVPFEPTIWQEDYSHTLVVDSYLGLDPQIVARQIEDDHIRAVILFSYGAGTIYEDIITAITEPARRRNIPVFIISPVNAEYKIGYESAKKIVEKGVVPLFMTLPSALAKVEITLRMFTDDLNRQQDFMKENYVGEIPQDQNRFNPVLNR